MPWWIWLKHLHVTCVVLSICGFLLRVHLMLRDSPLRRTWWVRRLPHMVDTTLLLSAMSYAALTHQYPWNSPWLAVKLACLLAYIGLGMVALRFGPSRRTRAFAGLGAVAVYAYIVAVALTRHPWPPAGYPGIG
jgi:uncharacterized membrane protein SirB2